MSSVPGLWSAEGCPLLQTPGGPLGPSLSPSKPPPALSGPPPKQPLSERIRRQQLFPSLRDQTVPPACKQKIWLENKVAVPRLESRGTSSAGRRRCCCSPLGAERSQGSAQRRSHLPATPAWEKSHRDVHFAVVKWLMKGCRCPFRKRELFA